MPRFRATSGGSGVFDAIGAPDAAEVRWSIDAAYGDAVAVVIDDGVVWGVCREGEVVGVDLETGSPTWAFACDRSPLPPALDQEQVYFVIDRELIAARRDDAREVWRVALPDQSWVAPVVAEGRVIIRSGRGRVLAFSSADGALIWERKDVIRWPHCTLLPVADGLVYIAHAEGFHACAVASGEIAFSYSGNAVDTILLEGELAVALKDRDPWVRVINAKTGERQRVIDLNEVGYPASFPVLSDGVLYAACEDWATVFRVDLRTAAVATLQNDVFGYGPLSMAQRRLYAHRSGSLVAIDPDDGRQAWALPIEGSNPSSVAIDGASIVVATPWRVVGVAAAT